METQREAVEKIDLSAHEEKTVPVSTESDIIPQNIISQFDTILGNHLDRLLGAKQGIEALPMNIFTVSCLILIATRETEIQTFPYLPPDRYTNETMLENLAEMNIESGDNLESYIKSMLDKRYMNISDDGRYFAGSPTMKMAQLFDRIFPKMPGLNLVAYLGQMIDEVFSKRKELKAALSQFDQMLNLHGVSLKKDVEPSHSEAGKLFPHLKVNERYQPVAKRIVTINVKPSDIFSQLETKTWKAPSAKPEIPATPLQPEQPEFETGKPADLPGEETANAFPEKPAGHEIDGQRIDIERKQEPAMSPGRVSAAQCDVSAESASSFPQPDGSGSILEIKQAPLSQGNVEQPEDDDIEKRIAAFEEQLGMACPLCRTSGILPRITAKGKKYYKCANEDCNFISWGKPYYITCPKCENPFLIESPDSQGKMMLKCPRATCPYWQKFPWEQDEVSDINPTEPEPSAETGKKTRKVVKRRRRVVVRRRA
jgi:ssDNA-binding Zn-finger/Zn-ribbon topoisomerase 1